MVIRKSNSGTASNGLDKDCPHCGYPIALRNPSGYCDHLYYPDNCIWCKTHYYCQVGEVTWCKTYHLEVTKKEHFEKELFEI